MVDEQAIVAKPVTGLFAEADTASEQVNQALLGTPAVVHERKTGADGREWSRVDLPDYSGWIVSDDLALEPGISTAAGADLSGVVQVVPARAQLETKDGPLTVYAGSLLRVSGGMGPDTIEVALPGGQSGRIRAADVRPVAEAGSASRAEVAEKVLATAAEYLETPYVWGGLTKEGIDCSGLVQTAYRVHGYTLPRDADQQYSFLSQSVAREDLEPGDLLYLGPSPERITHVGIYAGDGRVIHAARPQVEYRSIDPESPDFGQRWVDEYQGARRVIE